MIVMAMVYIKRRGWREGMMEFIKTKVGSLDKTKPGMYINMAAYWACILVEMSSLTLLQRYRTLRTVAICWSLRSVAGFPYPFVVWTVTATDSATKKT